MFSSLTFITSKNVDALKAALSNPPQGSKDQALKVNDSIISL